MNVEAVAQEIAGKLSAIEGLRAFAYPVASLPLPGAVVGLPDEVAYDATYRRGADSITLPLWVMVARGDDRAATKELAPYLNGSGDKSVKQALDDSPTNTYESCDTVTVTRAETGNYTYNNVDTWGAEFTIQISGPGS